jgi:hypothetical protein
VLAAPTDDLGSQSQQVRDAAALDLRESFVASPRSRWEPIVDAIKPGSSKESVLHLLQEFNVTTEFGVSSGQSFKESYRLDDAWLLVCAYRRSTPDTLLRHDLVESVRRVWVDPPQDFTGVWTTYFVNGQRSHEIHYSDGRYFGTFTTFHPNGATAVVQHYGPTGAEGEDIGYFPSGQVMYRGKYENGTPAGTWIHYNEDGSARATTRQPQP